MPGKVRLVTKLIDNRHRHRPSNTVQAFVTNTEDALSSKAAEMGAKQQPPLGMTARRRGYTCSRMGAGRSTREGRMFASVRKVKRTYRIRTRLASCFCSACQRSQYEECHVNRAYPGIVPALRDGQVRETVNMDSGVAPVDGSKSEELTFKSRQKTCQMARVTWTQSQESDLEAASKLWEELGREEEPTLIARFGQEVGFKVRPASCIYL